MKRRASPLGATLRARPEIDAPIVARIPAWTEVEGELIRGEAAFGEAGWLRVELYIHTGRLMEPSEPGERARRR